MKNKFLCFLLFISIPACTFAGNQKPTPTLSLPLLTPSPFITFTPSPVLTFTPSPIPIETSSPTPESSERLCSSDDFQTSSTAPDFSKPETLLGIQPGGDWPPKDWDRTVGIYNPEFNYSISGYKNTDQHIFILRKPICRYGKNRYSLSEIKDFLLIPNLGSNEIIIHSPTFEQCCDFQSNIVERFDFKWERFSIINCTETHPRAIMLAKYDLNALPNKIKPGTHLSVEVITGWLPNVNTNTFEEFPTAGMSCIISFQGA